MARLKIYRTAIGFHDAYVAAPSQKAALAAWGSDKDLFARGAAELVEETPLADDLLAAPGTVVKKLRGTAEEQMASLPPDRAPRPARRAATPREPKPPRPSRDRLDAAERALDDAAAIEADRLRDLADREAALARERRDLTRKAATQRTALERRRDDERRAFDDATRDWRQS